MTKTEQTDSRSSALLVLQIDQLLYDVDIAVYQQMGKKGKDINEKLTRARIALVELDRILYYARMWG